MKSHPSKEQMNLVLNICIIIINKNKKKVPMVYKFFKKIAKFYYFSIWVDGIYSRAFKDKGASVV
jgi:hypothetical protein